MTHSPQRGQTMPLVAGGMVATLLTCGLAVDAGHWRYQQRVEQAAADSAAVAGAISLNFSHPGSADRATSAARAAASANGFANGSNSIVVSVDTNPPNPPHPNKNVYSPGTAVAVTVSKPHAQFFSSLIPGGFGTGSSRSVAAAAPDTSACLYQLQVNLGILTIDGKFPLNLINCGAVTNGTVNLGPNGCGAEVTGLQYWAPNNVNGVPLNCGDSAQLASPANDPCPRNVGCSYLANTAFPALSGSAVDALLATALSPQAGLGYAVVKNCCVKTGTVTFAPGIYYIYGGISGTIEGDGVTIVNVDGAMTATGLGVAHPYWSAPTSGPTAGVAFYQPPSNANPINLDGGGNGTSIYDGLFYAPTAEGTSNGGSAEYSMLVIGDMILNGGGSLRKNQGLTVDPTLTNTVPPMPASFPRHVVVTE